MINLTLIIGTLGAITAACLFFPQIIASFKTKKTRDIAWSAIGIGIANGVFWAIYGYLINDLFILITNTVMFIGATTLLFLKRKYN